MSAIALHEMRHVLALGPALIELGVTRLEYDLLRIVVFADGEEGAVALAEGHGLPEPLVKQVLALTALGPLAALPDGPARLAVVPMDELGSKQHRASIAAMLSDADLALAAGWSGPPLTPGVVLRAAQTLDQRIGLRGRARLVKAITTATQEAAGEPLRLPAFLPFLEAERALRAAREALTAGVPT
ncbi:hypothetical protein [Paracoccus ravus]|uniref:hypothetical protein n=1 Tax=Paracoccus ravus TaxID=2447760 RepID=UPI00106DE146|nr:hypothetical protein [Paracoccus ravus]